MIEKEENKIWVVSFDIGIKNFAFCLEEYDKTILNSIPKMPNEKDRYNLDGSSKEVFSAQLDKLYKSGKIILFVNKDLSEGKKCENKLDRDVYFNMYNHLDNYKEYWDNCNVFVVEEQMSFGKKQNKNACKLAQHCQSYFMFYYCKFKPVVEFPAYHKTQVLGAPKIEKVTKKGKKTYKAMEKRERKKWAVIKAKQILELRNDSVNLEHFQNKKKKKGVKKLKLDDLSDCMLHNASFIYLAYVNEKY